MSQQALILRLTSQGCIGPLCVHREFRGTVGRDGGIPPPRKAMTNFSLCVYFGMTMYNVHMICGSDVAHPSPTQWLKLIVSFSSPNFSRMDPAPASTSTFHTSPNSISSLCRCNNTNYANILDTSAPSAPPIPRSFCPTAPNFSQSDLTSAFSS